VVRDYTPFDELSQAVSREVERVLEYNADKEEPEDVIEAVKDMLVQSMAYNTLLYHAVCTLEERLDVS